MKKIKTYFLVLGILCLTFPFNLATSWSNGSYSYDNVNYDYDTDYGTHDWIAEGALDALMAFDPNNWGWLNDMNRKKIYLVGTEAPDNSGVSMTLDGDLVEGRGDTRNHHVYILGIKTNVTEDDSAIRARECGDAAIAAIGANKLNKAAFYLGALTHYLADLAMYAHVAPNNHWPDYIDFDEHHSTVESRVLTRTNAFDNREEFFRYLSVTVGNMKPYDAAIDLAWETYQDPTPSESPERDAVWLHNNFFSDWASNYADRASGSSTEQKYYTRIEDSLNNAIEYCASAMNYLGGVESLTMPSYPLPVIGLVLGISMIGIILFEMKKNHFNFN